MDDGIVLTEDVKRAFFGLPPLKEVRRARNAAKRRRKKIRAAGGQAALQRKVAK